jgi:hypothetical protein
VPYIVISQEPPQFSSKVFDRWLCLSNDGGLGDRSEAWVFKTKKSGKVKNQTFLAFSNAFRIRLPKSGMLVPSKGPTPPGQCARAALVCRP